MKEIEIKWTTHNIQDTRERTKRSNLQKVGGSNKDKN